MHVINYSQDLNANFEGINRSLFTNLNDASIRSHAKTKMANPHIILLHQNTSASGLLFVLLAD